MAEFLLEGPNGEAFTISGPDNEMGDPFETAARRQRQAVQPEGGRAEGDITHVGEKIGMGAMLPGMVAAKTFIGDPLQAGGELMEGAVHGHGIPDPNIDPEGFQEYVGKGQQAAGLGMAGAVRLPGGGGIGELGAGGGRLFTPAMEWRERIADEVMRRWREWGVKPATGPELIRQVDDAMRNRLEGKLSTVSAEGELLPSVNQVEAGQVAQVIEERLRNNDTRPEVFDYKQKELPFPPVEVPPGQVPMRSQAKPTLTHLEQLNDDPIMRERMYRDALASGQITQQEYDALAGAASRGRDPTEGEARQFLISRLGYVPAGEPVAWARAQGWNGPATDPAAAPAIIAPTKGYLRGNDRATQAFNQFIGPHMNEQEFAQQYFSGMWNRQIEFHIGIGSRGLYLDWNGPLKIGDKTVGTMHRVIAPEGLGEDGKKTAYNAYLVLNDDAQGKGIAKNLLGNQVDLYDKMGLDEVGVHASLDRGGYSWARYGFLPHVDDWTYMRDTLGRKLDRVRSQIGDPLYQGVRAAINLNDPTYIWYISDVDIMIKKPLSEEKMPLGKYLLSGTSWGGKLDLHNPDQMTRFWDYVKPKR
jgi:GNAT superfamily N-acetyltransferase